MLRIKKSSQIIPVPGKITKRLCKLRVGKEARMFEDDERKAPDGRRIGSAWSLLRDRKFLQLSMNASG